jgi:streptogramin lyase
MLIATLASLFLVSPLRRRACGVVSRKLKPGHHARAEHKTSSSPLWKSLILLAFVLIIAPNVHAQTATAGGSTTPSATNFAAVNVGSTSATFSVPFTITGSGTFGAPGVLTVGATGQDFAALSSGSTCTGALTSGTTCTVAVTFTPKFAGTRYGAVTLTDATGQVVATAYIHGAGVGPEVTFQQAGEPGNSLGGGFFIPYKLAVDGNGNVYIVLLFSNLVEEIPTGCLSSTCVVVRGGGFNSPLDVAVDGSGNIYVADYGNGAVKEIPTGCLSSTCVTTLGGGFSSPSSVAVDGSGNVYVADYGNGVVKEIPSGCFSGSCVTTLGGSFSQPEGVAVDGSGNVYVADASNNALTVIPSGCSNTSCVGTRGGGFSGPTGVAVDGSGNIYVADADNDAVSELPPSCLSSSCVTTLGGGFSHPTGVEVDGAGDVYIADSGGDTVNELTYATPPSLDFKATAAGTQSSDSPQTVILANIGNAALTFSVPSTSQNPSLSAGFMLDNATTCPVLSTTSSPATLASGASCTLPVDAIPTVVGTTFGSLVLADNNLNGVLATQTFPLSETAVQITLTPVAGELYTATIGVAYFQRFSANGGTAAYTFSSTDLPSGLTLSAAGILSGTPTVVGNYSFSITVIDSSSPTPLSTTQNYTLTVNKKTPTITAAPTASSLTYGQTLASSTLSGGTASVAGTFAFTTPTTVATLGTASYSVTFTPTDTTDYTTAITNVSVTAGKTTPTITKSPTASSLTYGQTLASSTLSGGTASVAGTFAFTTPTTVATLGTASYAVTFTPTDTTDYVPVMLSVQVTAEPPPDFTFSEDGPQEQLIAPGATATYSFRVSPQGDLYPGALKFAVNGLPPGATYTLTPESIAKDGGAQNLTLSVKASSSLADNKRPNQPWHTMPAVLALLVLPLYLRRKSRSVQRFMVSLLVLCAALAASAILTGCGSDVLLAKYNITVTATGGTVQHTQTVVLDVKVTS